MKKVLILAYDFPPYISVGGLRPFSWYQDLHKFDVHPIVVTRQWKNKYGDYRDYISPGFSNEVKITINEENTLIEVPYKSNFSNRLLLKYGMDRFKLIRKIYSGILEILQYFLPIGTKRSIYKGAKEYLKKDNVDLIIATGDPFVLFHYASKLSKEYDVPWIADYRDLWSQNTQNEHKIFGKFEKNRELKVLKNASLFLGMSEIFNRQISALLPRKKNEIILNGYDSELYDSVDSIKQNSQIFTIVSAGSIFKYHPLKQFLEGLLEFKTQCKSADFKVKFYGLNDSARLEEYLVKEFQELSKNIEIKKGIPYRELIVELKGANLLLLFNYYCNMGTKIYDYLAANRKILFCFSADKEAQILKEKYFNISDFGTENRIQEKLINATNSGVIVENKNHLCEILQELHTEFSEKGKLKNSSNDYQKYSRIHQTKKLAQIINDNF